MDDVANTIETVIEQGAGGTVSIIKEIANQLGIAADKAGELVMMVVPQYAGMQVVKNSVSALMALVIIIIAVFALKRFLKWHKEFNFNKYDKFGEYCSLATALIVAAFVFIYTGYVFATSLTNAIAWGVFPFGELLEIALTNIK